MKKKIKGSSIKPRLYIFKSNKHIYAQIIDDQQNKIITSNSTNSNKIEGFATCEKATIIGINIAKELKKRGIEKIVFDRGKCLYHGQVKAIADGARQEGINF